MISKFFLFSLLCTIFIKGYKQVYQEFDANQRMEVIRLKNSSTYEPLFSAVTLTFFPINVLLLPLLLPVVLFKSERLNDFVLKIQYVQLIVMYSMASVAASVVICPLLVLKIGINECYLVYSSARKYQLKYYIICLFNFTVAPAAVALSLLIDLLTMPKTLLQDEKNFEYKYQNMEQIQDEQTQELIRSMVDRLFAPKRYQKKFKGNSQSMDQLMQ